MTLQGQPVTETQNNTFKTEHAASYALALVSLVLGVIGLLRGFGMLGDDPTQVGSPTTQAVSFPAIWDSMIWLLPALASGLLAWALHQSDHHRLRDPELAGDADEGGWKAEHAGAYLMALLSIACGALGILTGFDVFDRGNDQPDALPWLMASIVTAVLTNALHNVRHHQLATEDYVVRTVERRIGTGTGTATTSARPTTEPTTERRP
jgi:hypothetical protein